MEDTTISIIGIIIASILMLVVPLILIADRADDISQLIVQTRTAEFVNEIVKSGKITNDQYQKFLAQLVSSGNTYEIDMEIQILDENTSKIGDNNTYYSIFTSQIEEMIGKSEKDVYNSGEGRILLKQGDVISITVKNSSKTLSQSLKSFYYPTKSSNLQIITATASGDITINGIK